MRIQEAKQVHNTIYNPTLLNLLALKTYFKGMGLTSLIFLIAIGFAVLMVELFFLPGTSFFGAIGVLIMIVGIVLTYMNHGANTGHATLVLTSIVSVVATFIAFRKFTNSDLGLKAELDGRVNELKDLKVDVLDRGVAFGDIKPQGRARIGGNLYNVDSLGEFIEDKRDIEIVKITDQKIFVRPIK